MTLEIGLTDDFVNTQYAPLAVLFALYQHHHLLEPLRQVPLPIKTRDFTPADKLIQCVLGFLAGCGPLYTLGPALQAETGLAWIGGWSHFADPSTLSRTLDGLTQKQIEPLRQASSHIWQAHSQAKIHDWRGYLWLDFDLSGLPCSPRAQESQKGYFSGKKTPPGGNWRGSVRSNTAKRSGRSCIRAIGSPWSVSNRRWKRLKLLLSSPRNNARGWYGVWTGGPAVIHTSSGSWGGATR